MTIRKLAKSAAFAAATVLALSCSPVMASKSNDTLVVTWDQTIDTLDAYFNMSAEGIMFAREIWDTLILRDPDTFEFKPSLATSWTWVDDVTLDLELRRGVKFHDGQPFDADDVVYTITKMKDPATKVLNPSTIRWIERVEKLDQFKVRIRLISPFPAALEYLAGPVPIYPHVYYSKVGPKGMAQLPIGTGPYKVVKVEPGKEIVLEKGDGTGPRGSANIGKVIIRSITQKTTQIAELLRGSVDWVYNVPPDQIKNLQQLSILSTTGGETMRVVYMYIDAAGRSGKSPLQDVRVRRAIAHAINKKEFADTIVGGGASPAKAPCFRSQFGCFQDGPQYEYDPVKAKNLLVEAGYPNGFDTELYSYLPNQVNDALSGYLRAVGIRARIISLQYPAFHAKVLEGKTPLNVGGWASYRINDVSAILGNLFNGSPEDFANDPQVQELVKKGDKNNDRSVRLSAYKDAITRIMDQMYFLPISSSTIFYAYSKDLDFKTYPDEIPRYYLYRWK